MERPDLFIVARFLGHIVEAKRPLGKTELQLKANVNYTVFQRYLKWLLDRGLVRLQGKRGDVELTQAGRDAHARLASWIHDVVGRLA